MYLCIRYQVHLFSVPDAFVFCAGHMVFDTRRSCVQHLSDQCSVPGTCVFGTLYICAWYLIHFCLVPSTSVFSTRYVCARYQIPLCSVPGTCMPGTSVPGTQPSSPIPVQSQAEVPRLFHDRWILVLCMGFEKKRKGVKRKAPWPGVETRSESELVVGSRQGRDRNQAGASGPFVIV